MKCRWFQVMVLQTWTMGERSVHVASNLVARVSPEFNPLKVEWFGPNSGAAKLRAQTAPNPDSNMFYS